MHGCRGWRIEPGDEPFTDGECVVDAAGGAERVDETHAARRRAAGPRLDELDRSLERSYGSVQRAAGQRVLTRCQMQTASASRVARARSARRAATSRTWAGGTPWAASRAASAAAAYDARRGGMTDRNTASAVSA